MDFSEYKRLLGADPGSQEPAFLRARESSAEFREAADEANRFEARLQRALALETPAELLVGLQAIPRMDHEAAVTPAPSHRWWPYALAASLLVAIGAVSLTWRVNTGWSSVQEYVVDHYRHDGYSLLAQADEPVTVEFRNMLAEFGVEAAPELAHTVTVVKNCPTPDGKGVHMVLNTERGLITVIFMPDTQVTDGEQIAFDDLEAVLVGLQSGSAVIIGSEIQRISELGTFVQNSILPVSAKT